MQPSDSTASRGSGALRPISTPISLERQKTLQGYAPLRRAKCASEELIWNEERGRSVTHSHIVEIQVRRRNSPIREQRMLRGRAGCTGDIPRARSLESLAGCERHDFLDDD